MAFKLRTPAFGPGGEIPLKYTGAGADISPALRWTGPPEGTKSFALTVDDRDDRSGIWVHWALYGISGTIHNSLKVSRGRTPCRGSEPRA